MSTTTRLPKLTDNQCDGVACVVCGDDHRPMLVVPDVETRSSTHLFHCDRPECATTPAEVRARIPHAHRVAA